MPFFPFGAKAELFFSGTREPRSVQAARSDILKRLFHSGFSVSGVQPARAD
jgi:hypothetical protein